MSDGIKGKKIDFLKRHFVRIFNLVLILKDLIENQKKLGL